MESMISFISGGYLAYTRSRDKFAAGPEVVNEGVKV
jgi:hypothetical protein